MRYFALATDYDGTLAHDGGVDAPTREALARLRGTGRKLIMVTGRELPELLGVFPHAEAFDWIVAENGALLYQPSTKEATCLAEPPPGAFVERLRAKGVDRISVGRVIVALWEPHQKETLEAIRELGLELQVIFNKGAVMVLPSGVNKATGLTAALAELRLSPHNVVGVGDAENDHAFLALCECAVAVANALPSVKDRADWVTVGARGSGVTELIDRLGADDLEGLDSRLQRHHILLGFDDLGREVRIPPHGSNVLICGTSGSGKTEITAGLLERLAAAKYQFCIFDPEGDYADLERAVVLGDPDHPPGGEDVLALLEKPETQDAVVNLRGIGLADRPGYFQALLPRVEQLRSRIGRPHWIVVDKAHLLMPRDWTPTGPEARVPTGLVLVTVHPGRVSKGALEGVDVALAVGEAPGRTLEEFCEAMGRSLPSIESATTAAGDALAWWPRSGTGPVRLRPIPTRAERRRHGPRPPSEDLGPRRSFVFRGPDGILKLRAQNLALFLQIAEGVDEATWLHHLQQGDYASWFREAVGDEELAAEVERIAAEPGLSAAESLSRVRRAIGRRHALPAGMDTDA